MDQLYQYIFWLIFPSILTLKTLERRPPKIFAIHEILYLQKWLGDRSQLFVNSYLKYKKGENQIIYFPFYHSSPVWKSKRFHPVLTLGFRPKSHHSLSNKFLILKSPSFYFIFNFIIIKTNRKIRSQILMNFVSVPVVALFRSAFCPMTLPQIMALALSTDFQKYTLAFAFNELPSSEKDDKKSEYAETNISPMSSDDLLIAKNELKEAENTEKNRKKQDSVQIQKKSEEHVQTLELKKRQSYQKARSQITQTIESCERSHGEQGKDEKKEVQDEISQKVKQQGVNQQQKVIGVRKQKRIKKIRRVQKVEDKNVEVGSGYISTRVSLIDTIDHPRITIDRFEIERKKQNLLIRAFVYDEALEQRRFSYQIRERRQLKKLN